MCCCDANVNIDHGWVNRTIAQVVSLAQNCIVLCQVDKPKEHLLLPHFKQLITIAGASYHNVCQQLYVKPALAVTVHRVHGMTVKTAVIILNKSFFESGQAYVSELDQKLRGCYNLEVQPVSQLHPGVLQAVATVV